jgi:sodium transport system permease protein
MRGTFLVLKKELIEFLKDRKTLFFMAMPLILYPTIYGMMSKLAHRDSAQRKGNPSRIVLQDPSGVIRPLLEKDPKNFTIVAEPADLSKAIYDDVVDLKLTVPAEASELASKGTTFAMKIGYDDGTRSSDLAYERLKKALESEQGHLVEQRFHALGAATSLATPFTIEKQDVGDLGRALSKILGMWLPYVLLISMYAGSMQHGAYMSAGERERGTLLSLLATKLPRRDIIFGKQLALFVLSIVTAIMQLGGMALGMAVIGQQESAGMASAKVGAAQATSSLGAISDPKTLILTLLLLIPLGMVFTAIVLLVGVQSRNTREATTALTPGIFVVVMLGVFTMAPGVEKMAALPWIPVVNVLVIIRKLFSGQYLISHYLVALGMTVLLAAMITSLASKVLNRESALFKA